MARARRQHDHVTSRKLERFAAFSAELNPRVTARDTERFVNHRVVVHERVDTVAPLPVAPAIIRKPRFNGACGRIDRALVDENRQRRIVGHLAVVLEQVGEVLRGGHGGITLSTERWFVRTSFRDGPAGPDPESRCISVWVWIPGSRLRRAPE